MSALSRPTRIVALLLLLSSCAEQDAPSLVLATQPTCEAETQDCSQTGARDFVVDGVQVLHQRLVGHPLVSLRLTFDRRPELGGKQRWAETEALNLVRVAGPRRIGYGAWARRLAELSSELGGGNGPDYLSFTISAPRPHWRTVWGLMVEAVTDPSTDGYLLEHDKRSVLAEYESELDAADTAAQSESFSRLFRGQRAARASGRVGAAASRGPRRGVACAAHQAPSDGHRRGRREPGRGARRRAARTRSLRHGPQGRLRQA